jgi:hypothetical protein
LRFRERCGGGGGVKVEEGRGGWGGAEITHTYMIKTQTQTRARAQVFNFFFLTRRWWTFLRLSSAMTREMTFSRSSTCDHEIGHLV